jgi:acetyl esterase/lipase
MLVRSALHAAGTANAIRPFARRGAASIPSFFHGWMVTELPLHTSAIQALGTANAIRNGALRTWSGRSLVALDAIGWAQRYRLHREAGMADRHFDDALADELGADYRDRAAVAGVSPVDRSIPITRLIQPFSTARRTLAAQHNLSYGEAGKRNYLDVWKHPDLPVDGRAPVLLQVHGGAWMIGNKDQQGQPLMEHLTGRGWVCVAINYSLSPNAAWPAHIIDVKRAITWVKANIARYGGDPNFIAITGGSAGGHLTALAALTPNEPMFQPGFEDDDTTLQAAVPFYGVYDFLNRDGTGRADMQAMLEQRVFQHVLTEEMRPTWESASPMGAIRSDAPPFMVIHGTNDSLVPVEQARAFAEMLRKESTQPVVYAELPRAQHAFDVFWSPRTWAAVHAVERFLGVVRADAPSVALNAG